MNFHCIETYHNAAQNAAFEQGVQDRVANVDDNVPSDPEMANFYWLGFDSTETPDQWEGGAA